MARYGNPSGAGSRFLREVSLVLYVIDDFTIAPAPPERITVYMAGGASPIKKADGYFVFTDLPAGDYEIILNALEYQPRKLKIHLGGGADEGDGKTAQTEDCQVITVRMLPGPAYRFGGRTARMAGWARAGALIRAVYTPESGGPRLLYDYQGGPFIRIFWADVKNLDGRMFMIGGREYFTGAQTVDEDERVYRLEHPLEGSYKKGKADLKPAAATMADGAGQFFLAAAGVGQEELACRLDDGENTRDIRLKAGEITTVDLTGEVD